MINETDLPCALRDLADQEDPGPVPVVHLLARGRRSKLTSVTVKGVVITAVVAAVAVGAVVVGGGAQTGPRAPTAMPTTQAQPSFVLAAQTSAQMTFRFTLTIEYRRPPTPRIIWYGVVDPPRNRFSLKDPTGHKFHEQRSIGDRCYQQLVAGGPWFAQQESCGGTDYANSWFTNPLAALDELTTKGTTTYVGRTGSGADAIDTWTFTLPTSDSDNGYILRYGGTVSVIVATNLVRTVALDSSMTPKDPSRTDLVASEWVNTFDFSDYGRPVNIEPPK